MSQENVELVRRFARCWAQSDWEGTAALVDPDVEMHATVGGVEEGQVTRGIDAMRRDYERAEETWEEHRIELDDVIDAGDSVVLLHQEYQRGKSSGVELEIEAAVVFDVRDGRIVRIQGYMNRAEALKAAGVGDSAQET